MTNATDHTHRAVITGMGTISSLGGNVAETLDSLQHYRTNFETVPPFRFSTENKVLRNNKIFQISPEAYRTYLAEDPAVLGAVTRHCIAQAMDEAGVDAGTLGAGRTAFSLGMSVSTTFVREQVILARLRGDTPDVALMSYNTPRLVANMISGFGINGIVSVISTACSSGTNSIGRALDLIRLEKADYVICGGIDIVSGLAFNGFNSLLAISKQRCMPFGVQRDGMSLGDGCAMFVVESLASARRRGAPVLAEIRGYSFLNEAYHPTSPHPDGIYALECMRQALSDGGATAEEVDYINAHGTGTKMNDAPELKAIETLLEHKNEPTPYNSTKGLTGHTLGGAGSVEAMICILAMRRGMIFGDGRDYEPLPAEKARYISKNTPADIRLCLSNSFAFAGNMASVLLATVEEA